MSDKPRSVDIQFRRGNRTANYRQPIDEEGFEQQTIGRMKEELTRKATELLRVPAESVSRIVLSSIPIRDFSDNSAPVRSLHLYDGTAITVTLL